MQSPYDKIQYYKLGQEEKTKIISKLKAALAREKRIRLAILFGSVTRRNYVRDIDLAIHDMPELSFKELLNLNAQIELELGIPVDIIELTNIPASFKVNILKNGTIIKGTKTQQHQLLNQLTTALERC